MSCSIGRYYRILTAVENRPAACYTGVVNMRGLLKAACLGAFLLSAFNYCPPGAEAVSAAAPAMDCCRKAPSKSSPSRSKKESKVSCCTAERLASGQVHARHARAERPLPQAAAAFLAAPQVQPHRLARTLIRPAGPPGAAVLAAAGSLAPPLA